MKTPPSVKELNVVYPDINFEQLTYVGACRKFLLASLCSTYREKANDGYLGYEITRPQFNTVLELETVWAKISKEVMVPVTEVAQVVYDFAHLAYVAGKGDTSFQHCFIAATAKTFYSVIADRVSNE